MRVLLIRFSSLGDVLLTFPAVRALREAHPSAELVYLTDIRHLQALEGLEVIDEAFGIDRLGLRRFSPVAASRAKLDLLRWVLLGRWDVAIDLQGFAETAWIAAATRAPVRVGRRVRADRRRWFTHWIDEPHAAEHMSMAHRDTMARAGLLKAEPLPAGPFFTVTRRAMREWQERGAAPAGSGPRIGLYVGAARPEKCWAPERFAQAAALVAHGLHGEATFLVFGGPGDQAIVDAVRSRARHEGIGDRVHAGGLGSLGALAAAWKGCALVIANDTGPMHLGVAVGTPTLGIFRRPMPHFWPPPPHRGVAPEGERELDAVEVGTVADEALSMLRV